MIIQQNNSNTKLWFSSPAWKVNLLYERQEAEKSWAFDNLESTPLVTKFLSKVEVSQPGCEESEDACL